MLQSALLTCPANSLCIAPCVAERLRAAHAVPAARRVDEDDDGYQEAQDALEEMFEEVGWAFHF